MKRQKVIAVILAVAAVIILCLFVFKFGNIFIEDEYENVILPEDEIILMERHISYSMGYRDFGIFVNSSGEIYYFDFTVSGFDRGGVKTDEEIIERLKSIGEHSMPLGKIDEMLVKKIYYCIENADPVAGYTRKHQAMDAEDTILFYYDLNTKTIKKCCEKGNFIGESDDLNIKKLIKLYDDNIKRQLEAMQ